MTHNNYLARIDELVTNLQNHNMSADEISRFLALKTFSDIEVNSVAISQVTSVGTLASKGSYGSRSPFLVEWASLPLTISSPIAVAVLASAISIFIAGTNWAEKFPALASFKDDARKRTVISIPMMKSGSPIGAITILTNRRITLSDHSAQFLTATASVLSLAAVTAPIRKMEVVAPPSHQTFTILTARQLQILKLLAKKKTNKEIAKEIGQSESTVRHETIRIFAHLGVHGRNQAAEMYNVYLQSHPEKEATKPTLRHLSQIAD